MRTAPLLLVLLLSAGCGGDDDGGGADADAAPEDEADAAPEQVGACPGPSIAIDVDGSYTLGEITEPGERDRYRFTADAGTWVVLDITANVNSDPERLDSVLRLYGPDGELIVENDDSMPKTGVDSEIITRLAATGEHCVEVLDLTDADGDDDTEPVGGANYTYDLATAVLDAGITNATFDPEDGDEVADAAEVEIGTTTRLILGQIDPDDDDYFSFTMPEVDGSEAVFGVALPPGPQGTGATGPARGVSIILDDPDEGSPTIALIAPGSGQTEIAPPLRSGPYLVRVWRGGTPAGSNDFYVIKAYRGDENPSEAGGDNDTVATAEPLTMTDVGDATTGFITADLPGGDVDYFSFPVSTGQHLRITCRAESAGSGVRDLVVDLRDDADASVADADETPSAAAVVEADITEDATYALGLAAGTPAVDVTSRFVRCGVHLTES